MIKKSLIGIIAVLFLLSSCSSPESKGGGDSLSLSILSITSNVYETNPITLVLELKNNGKYNINQGKLSIGNFDPDYITGFRASQGTSFSNNAGNFQLEGRSENYPEGGSRIITLTSGTAKLPTDMPYSTSLTITACYAYETNAVATVCIDTEPFSGKVKTGTCSPNSVQISPDQGAPVKLTGVEVESYTNFAYIKFDVSSNGDIYDLKDVQSCDEGIPREDMGVVNVKSIVIGNTPLSDCTHLRNGKLYLINGQGTFSCKYNYPSNLKGRFPKQVGIVLDYGVRTSIETSTVTIKKAES